MSGNKYLTPDETSLFQTKLDVLTKRLQTSSKAGVFSTKEEFVKEATRVIRDFYKYLNSPFFDPRVVNADDEPNADYYNNLWNVLIDDLTVIFTELENVESSIVENFNEIMTSANRMSSRVKNIRSKLADYAMFANNSDPNIIYFKETFDNLARVDVASKLLNRTECSVNQDEGVITLPIDTSSDSRVNVTKPIVINSLSNGDAGNNEETGAVWNGDLSVILDDNPDTWFEYEKVVSKSSDAGIPLTLDITINIGSVRSINFIRINPNDFGKPTLLEIEKIELSKDGGSYEDVMSDIGTVGIGDDERDGIFSLGATSGKNTGEGIYTFLPRQAKYVHVVLKQTIPYTIVTAEGEKSRYAIGIRDIELRSFAYLSAGELVSTDFSTVRQVRRLLLEANQTPKTNSDLVEVHYLVSPDDGATWHEVLPKDIEVDENDDTSPPRILIFNTSDPGSIAVSSDVNSLRTKLLLVRNNDAFISSSPSFKNKTRRVSELHAVPEGEPFDLTLGSPPVNGSVYVLDPAYGSRGLEDYKYVLVNGVDQTADKQVVSLPFNNLQRPTTKTTTTVSGYNHYNTVPVDISNFMRVFVGGAEWRHSNQLIETYSGGTEKVWNYNSVSGVLRFGDGDNTATPYSADSISVMFTPERIYPSDTTNRHLAELLFPTSYSKSRFEIKYYEQPIEGVVFVSGGATTVDFGHTHLLDITDVESIMTTLGYTTKRSFINGRDELRSSVDWSIDTVNGRLYVREPFPSNADIVLPFTYTPVGLLENKDFDFVSADGTIANSIEIRETGWHSIVVEDEETRAESSSNIHELGNQAVVKGTLTLSITAANPAVSDSNNPFIKEVPFVDGRTELGSSVSTTREEIAALTPTANVASFTLNENISSNTAHKVAFSKKTLFVTEVSITPAAAGEYMIDYTGANANRVQVYTESSVSDPGYITYFYSDSTYKDNGLYSIDYNNGKIYMQRRYPSVNDWVVSADYQYTNYLVSYRIARLVDPSEYTVDLTANKVIFNESEVLTRESIPRDSKRADYYTVNYDTIVSTNANPEALRTAYSPIVRNYSLKILLNEND